MPYSVLTTIAMSTSYLLLIDDAVFDDWILAHVFISEGEVPPPCSACDRPSAVANALACAAGVHERAGRGDL